MSTWRDLKLGRRRFVAGAAGVGAGLAAGPLARPALGAQKPEKLVFMIDNAPWHGTMTDDAAPAFEKETGIHVEFTALPDDALIARLKAEFSAESSSIDITQFGATWVSWCAPHMEDATKLLANATGKYAENFGLDDISKAVQKIGIYDGKLCGIPYRVTMGLLHYQPEVLKQAGFDHPPATWDELRDCAVAITKAGDGKRYGLGVCLRQGPAIADHWVNFLRSNGGGFYDAKTREIFINKPNAVEALAFYGDLATKYKVIPPDAVTWEWDEIIANGQNDRYGMAMTLGPSGTMLNDPKVSKTGGRWAATVVPGAHAPDQSRTFLSGWSLGVPRYSRNTEWAFAFLQMVASREWSLKSMEKGNASPRASVLLDPEIGKQFVWAPAAGKALETAVTDPQDAIYGALELPLRLGIARVTTGQAEALDTVATNWQRIMRRGATL
jgi:ABC-type glycerol-3-phosphate transport system substrate-binding protein